ncbi:DUF4181 domain-containing protein [Caryophanon tenue]|nr:DUF4181 domain-containing protein [Caryophanon tenue]
MIILVGAFLAAVILEVMIRKRITVAKNERYQDQYINKKHMFAEILLLVMYLTILSSATFNEKTLYAFLFLFLAIMFIIRAFLDFVYRNAHNRHYISAMYVVICLVGAAFALVF